MLVLGMGGEGAWTAWDLRGCLEVDTITVLF